MRGIAAVTAILLVAVGGSAMAEERLRVVATFSILADFVQAVAGERVQIETLVGPNGDPHAYDPPPSSQGAIAGADLIIANGLGLEPWLERAITAAEFRGGLVIASDGIEPLRTRTGLPDPHAFQDPKLAIHYVRAILRALSATDPHHADIYKARASDYIAAIEKADRELRAGFAPLAPERRRALTAHESLAYFGRAYAIEFVPIQSKADDESLSAGDLARLIERAKTEAIRAIFLENMVDPRLAQTVAKESGVKIGGAIHADSLSPPEGPAPDYLSLLRHNGATILEALR